MFLITSRGVVLLMHLANVLFDTIPHTPQRSNISVTPRFRHDFAICSFGTCCLHWTYYCRVLLVSASQILDDYAKKMRDAENESHEGKRKTESLWPIMRISHARSRYIYELYYSREAISKELYDWLLKEGYADAK